jgi:hypothetical protein
LRLSFVSSCNVFTKDHSIPENRHITCCDYLLYPLAKFLQKIVASQKNRHGTSHHMLRLSFLSSCNVFTKDHSIPENQHITSHVILLQSCYKDSSIPYKPTHHITCCDYLTTLSLFWWTLVIVRDNSAIARTTLRGLKCCWVVSNKNEISSK